MRSAVDAGRGRILVHIGNHNQPNGGETLQTESADGGPPPCSFATAAF